MAKPKILHMLDPRANVSPFDVNMAVDAGYEVVVPYSGTGADDVTGLVQDAIFSRPPGRYNETGVFIGGHDVNLAADMLERARGAMVGPFEVAVMADPNGAYTTSAALVALIEKQLRARSGAGLEGRSVQILGGGPVGLCTAVLVAQGGGHPRLVRLTPMTPARAEPVERFAGRYEVELPWVTGSDDAEKHAALESADVAVCCAKAGIQVLSADLMARCATLAVVADVNAVPPSGIEGLAVTDDGVELPSGALGNRRPGDRGHQVQGAAGFAGAHDERGSRRGPGLPRRVRARPRDRLLLSGAHVSMLPSVNATAAPLVAELEARADALRVGVSRMDDGTCVVDAGIDQLGGLEAGLLVARICMGGLGHAALRSNPVFPEWPWQVEVRTSQPVLACLGAQYAGWSLSFDAPEKFSALGSGPARALAAREPLFEELGYRDRCDRACLVLETDRRPPAALAEKVSTNCGVDPERLTLVLTPTGSLAGVVQIAARVVEVALHKAHEIGFPLDAIVDGAGSTPLPPPIDDALTAMGRTNDTILFGGQVQLFVSCEDEQAEDLATPASQQQLEGLRQAVRPSVPGLRLRLLPRSIRCCSVRRGWR